MESGLKKFLEKHYGDWESVKINKDNGKTIWLTIDFGDDEIMNVTINRLNGENGNYRIVVEG